MLHWILDNKEWVVGAFVSLSSFLTGRKTAKAAVENDEIQNLKATRNVEKELFADLERTIDRYQKILKENETFILKLERIIKEQKIFIEKLKKNEKK